MCSLIAAINCRRPVAAGLDLGFGVRANAAQGIQDRARLFAALNRDAAGIRRIAVAPAVGCALTRQIEEHCDRRRRIAVGARPVIVLDSKAKIVELIIDCA